MWLLPWVLIGRLEDGQEKGPEKHRPSVNGRCSFPQSCYAFLMFEGGADKLAHSEKGVGSGEGQEETRQQPCPLYLCPGPLQSICSYSILSSPSQNTQAGGWTRLCTPSSVN